MNRRRLGLRLVASYVIGLIAALLLFAATAVFSIDRAERSSLDSRLAAAGNAILPMIEVRNGRLVIDKEDERQFLDVLGVRFSGVVEDARGRVVLSNVSRLPPALAKRSPATPETLSLGRGKDAIRVRTLPVTRGAHLYGAVIVWGPSEWINETDLRTALAFVVATLLIAIFAAIAGNIVTKRALDDALQRQRRFTADASHELRAPLSVVMAEADFALAKEVRAPSEYAISLRAIQGEAMRMETLVDDLLWTTRTDGATLCARRRARATLRK
jgi:signal transduction histidine kinase